MKRFITHIQTSQRTDDTGAITYYIEYCEGKYIKKVEIYTLQDDYVSRLEELVNRMLDEKNFDKYFSMRIWG